MLNIVVLLVMRHFLRHTQIGNEMKFIKNLFNRQHKLDMSDVRAWARMEYPNDVEWAVSHFENTGNLPKDGANRW